MSRFIERRQFLTVCAGATAVGLAGCSGSGDDDGDDGDGSGAGNGAGSEAAWRRFDFATTGTYTFEFYAADAGTSTLTWSVQEVDGDQVTVGYEMEIEGMSIGGQSTFTTGGGIDEMDPIAAGFLGMTAFHPLMDQFGGQALEVGEGWSHTWDGQTVAYEVTGTSEHAGIECYTTEITENGRTVYEACLAEDHGIAIHTAFYEEDGSLAAEQTLVDYSPEADPTVGENGDFGGGDFGGGDFGDGDFDEEDFDDFDEGDFDF